MPAFAMSGVSRVFADRRTAGVALGHAVAARKLPPPVVVLGLPRGGVPVAYEVARALHASLDVMPVRKIGAPGQPEFAIGAIAPADVSIRNPAWITGEMEYSEWFAECVGKERVELARRERVYRAHQPPLDLKERTVVLVDDGLATGLTMLAAVRATRRLGASRIVAAAPVASDEAAAYIGAEADDVVFLKIPGQLSSVAEWYEEFEQLSDEEVVRLLQEGRATHLHLAGSKS